MKAPAWLIITTKWISNKKINKETNKYGSSNIA